MMYQYLLVVIMMLNMCCLITTIELSFVPEGTIRALHVDKITQMKVKREDSFFVFGIVLDGHDEHYTVENELIPLPHHDGIVAFDYCNEIVYTMTYTYSKEDIRKDILQKNYYLGGVELAEIIAKKDSHT